MSAYQCDVHVLSVSVSKRKTVLLIVMVPVAFSGRFLPQRISVRNWILGGCLAAESAEAQLPLMFGASAPRA